MFAVPKDTQLLIFTIPFSSELDISQITSLENQLSEKTGIPCVIFDRYVDPQDAEYGDFEIRWQEDAPSPEPPAKEDPAAVPYEYTARIELSEVLVKLNLCISIVEALALAVLILG